MILSAITAGWKYSPFLASALILFIQAYPQLINPTFPGDSGTRLLNASSLVVGQQERVWLPFLQFQIMVLYILKAPLIIYKLLPLGYFALFLLILNCISLRLLGSRVKDVLFTALLLGVLVSRDSLIFLATNLYQETLALTVLYALLYLYFFSSRKRIFMYVVMLASLLLREDFWVYYLSFGLLAIRRRSVLDAKEVPYYFVAGLIPLLWIFYTNQPFYLGVVREAPLNLGLLISRVGGLLSAFFKNSLPIISLSVLLVSCFSGIRQGNRPLSRIDVATADYRFVSLISLGGILIYDIVRGPWPHTPPYSTRMLMPLVIVLPMWILICFKESQFLPKNLKLLVIFVLLIGVISLSNYPPTPGKMLVSKADYHSTLKTTIEYFKKSHHIDHPLIGIFDLDYWNEYVPYLSGPLLYEDRLYIIEENNDGKPRSLDNVDILISRQDFTDAKFMPRSDIQFGRNYVSRIFFRLRK